MFLFARWITTCYDTSVLNRENGEWWKEQLKHFNTIVYPNLIKNGSVADATGFINGFKEKKLANQIKVEKLGIKD